MAALLIGYAVAIAVVFSRLGKSQPTDREGDQWSEKWQKPIKWRD